MRSATSHALELIPAVRLICLLSFGIFISATQTLSIHAQSAAKATSTDELARPLEPADVPDSADSNIPTTKPQIAEQSANLLKMAVDLKNEVNRTNEKTISAAALRKADEIERLVKEMRSGGHDVAHR